MGALHSLGIDVKVWPMPVEVPRPVRFNLDESHAHTMAKLPRRNGRLSGNDLVERGTSLIRLTDSLQVSVMSAVFAIVCRMTLIQIEPNRPRHFDGHGPHFHIDAEGMQRAHEFE